MENEPLRIGLIGASGRFGKAIATRALADARFSLIAALTHLHSQHLGADLGALLSQKPLGIPLTPTLDVKVDLLIDASLPSGLAQRLSLALEYKLPLVIGTTGFSNTELQLLKTTSSQIPIFYSPNFSLGMALLNRLVREIARYFSHIDLIETHHNQKKDTPSGSALRLAKTIEASSSSPVKIHSLRSGQVVGEHTLLFTNDEERLILTHEVHSRDAFARGALEAALFLKTQKCGFFSMENLLS